MMYNIRSCTVRLQVFHFLSDGNGNVLHLQTNTCENSQLKSLTLNISVKVIEYNICSYAVRWRISGSKKSNIEKKIAISCRFRDNNILKF